MVLGGGGSPAPLSELLLQLAFAPLFVIWFAYAGRMPAPAGIWVGGALLLCVPVIQLIPWPAALWHALPGRAPLIDALSLTGQADRWWPLSLAPERTFASLMAMIPVVAMLPMAASLTGRWRMALFGLIAGVALVSFFVGVGQMANLGGGIFRFYSADSEYFLGFQANRNSQADVFLIGGIASAVFVRHVLDRKSEQHGFVAWLAAHACLSLLFLLGTVLTGSRMGMMLAPLSLAGQLVVIWPWLMRLALPLRRFLLLGGMVVLAVALAAALGNPVLQAQIGRFGQGENLRPEIWHRTWQIITVFQPWGSGIGTFVPVYQSYEPLSALRIVVINRAHCDYLEWLLETGWIGVVAMVAALAVMVGAARRTWRQGAIDHGTVLGAAAVLLVIVIHSFVDYPLRSMSLGGLTTVMIAFLAIPCPGHGAVTEPAQ